MNADAKTFHPRGEAARADFSRKTNPNRPAAAEGAPWRETRGEDRSFSEKCDPRHAYRPLTEEQRELVTKYMPMARRLAHQVGGAYVDREELEAEAYAALVEAARMFNPDRGVNFAVYARPRLFGAIRDYRRFLFHANWKGDREASPVFQRLGVTDDIHGQVVGRQPEAPVGRDIELPEVVESVIRLLPRSQAFACRSLYLEGKSVEETAVALGCSKGYVSRLHSDALDQLRHYHREALAG